MPNDLLYYLATPYTKYASGIEKAYIDACRIAADLIRRGHKVYSPIAHTHGIATHGGIDPTDYEIWLAFNETMMQRCDAIMVARLPGWQESFGVLHEIKRFGEMNKSILFFTPKLN
jgi:hypothetical protein